MKRNIKRLPALLLAILLCLSLLPVTAGAANATTVQVGGVELNTTTAYAVTENGTVTTEGASNTNWNIKFEAGTLTLNGANIADPYTDGDGNTYGIYADGDLTLMLENASTVESSDTAFNYGVYINGSLTVSGSGSLTVSGSGENSYGVYVANTMTANSGSITGSNTSTDYDDYGDGIYVGNALTVAGGTVTGSGKSSNYSKNGAGIRVSAGGLTVSGGSVTGTTTGTYGTGIRLETGALTVSGSGSVEGTANGNLGDGIYVGNTMKVSGSGSVEGTANGSKGEGIYVRRGDATVEGGSVTGTASIDGYHGIFVDFGALTVSGGSVTGTAYNEGRNGIHVNNALTVEGGSVTGTANGEKGSGIQVNKLTVSAGSVAGTANGDTGYGIWVNSGDITITNAPTVTATSKTAGYTVMIKDVYQLLVNGTRYEPSANATVFKVVDGAVSGGGEEWALDIWVNGVKISDDTGSTVNCGEGTAKYDPDTGTLTLTNAAISNGYAINVSGSSVACGIYAESDLNIELVGNSTVGTSDTAINIGVYVEGDLTVSGSGTLTTAETDMGICAEGAMTVESGTVISNGKNYGIFVDRLTVSGSGSVEGTATGSNSYGIRVDTDLMVTGGSVTGTSTGSNSCGIVVADVLEVSGSGSVTGEGAKYGVYVSEGVLEVSGSGSVTGTATGSSSDGIRVRFYLAANGGSVNGTGKRAGICLEQGALEVEGGTVTGEGANYGIDVAQKTLTVSGSGSVSGTATGSEGEGIYVYSALTVSGSGDVTGTGTAENGWGIDVYEGALKVTGGSVTGTGDSTGIYANSGLTVSGGDVTGTGTAENGWGIDAALLNMTGGSVTGKGTEAAIVAYRQGSLAAGNLISVPTNYVPSGYGAQAVVVQNSTYASFAETGKTLEYNSDAGTFTNAATEITLKAPGAVSFPQQFYASINFADGTGYKSFGHVTKSGNEWMIYKETGDVADRTIYGMESAGGAIFTVESDNDEAWMLRVYSSDLATSRTIGRVTNQSGTTDYAIVDTAMDLSGEEPALYGTYNQAFGNQVLSFICSISLTDGTTSNWLQVTGIPSTDIIYAMAFDENGKLYAIGADAGDDGGPASLYTIDLSSGAATATKVGDIKENGRAISTNYVQDLAYDYNTRTLYWMENMGNALYTVDAASAAATKVGQVRFEKDSSLKTYSLSAFCILDGVPATSDGKHMVSVIYGENVTVTDGSGTSPKAVSMLGNGDSLTLKITPDPELGLWYVKVDGQKISITDPMAEITQTIQVNGKDHVIEVASRLPNPVTRVNKWDWLHYQGKPAKFYTQEITNKFYDWDRFNPDSDTPDTDYTQTLLDENEQAIADDTILLPGLYGVRVTHPGTEKYAPLTLQYNDALDLAKCDGTPGRPVVYGKVGCKQGDLTTTSALQDYYDEDGELIDAAHDEIPVTLVWQEPDKIYDQAGYFSANADIYAAELSERILACYNDDEGNPLYEGCLISARNTQVIVLPADEASLIKLEVEGDEGCGTVSGKGVYKNGDDVTVTATANTNAGYVFWGWQDENGQIISDADATYTFEANGDCTLTAVFVSEPYYLVKLEADPTDGGTVTGGGNYEENDSATITAIAKSGYYFIGWYKAGQEEAVSTNTEYTFIVPENGITLTARFGVDYLTKAEQAKENFANAVNNNTLRWAILEQAVEAYKEAEDFMKNPPSVIPNAQTRFIGLTAYYQSITTLNLSNQDLGSADLTKLDFFTDVTELDLSNNKGVSDLSALKDLTLLETLDISGTGVTKLDSLITKDSSKFPGYISLMAENLSLTSISALAELVSAESFGTDTVTKWDFTGSTLPNTEENKADVETLQTKLGDAFIPPTIQTMAVYDISVSPNTLNFGSVYTNYEQPAAQTVKITNMGNQNMTLTLSASNHYIFGAFSPSADVAPNDTVSFTIQPKQGLPAGNYDDVLTIFGQSGNQMPHANVTLLFEVRRQSSSSGGGTSSGPDTYPITVSESLTGGSITVSHRSAAKENTVTITVTPDEGYELKKLSVTDAKGNEVKLMNKGNGKYTFTMPKSKVEIKGVFQKIAPVWENCPGGVNCPAYSYRDVNVSAWYHEAVDYVLVNGLMNGYGNDLFGPNDSLSRTQLCQILYNKEGRPAITGSSAFTDVAGTAWYADAVIWSNANGIVGGYGGGLFGPGDSITREQLAAILHRYAQYKAYDVSQGDMAIREFADYETISSWAVESMAWAVNAGLISGMGDGTLNPQGYATRAQAAQMLMGLLQGNRP